MKYIVYLTINLKNFKFYIGVHETEDPNVFDGYLGCGVNCFIPSSYKKSKTAFQYAVNKYGTNSFRRITLRVFDKEEDAYKMEEAIVTEDFIKSPVVYNMTTRGHCGPDQSVTIYQYGVDGKFITSYPSYLNAASKYKCSASAIKNAVMFKNKSCGFF